MGARAGPKKEGPWTAGRRCKAEIREQKQRVFCSLGSQSHQMSPSPGSLHDLSSGETPHLLGVPHSRLGIGHSPREPEFLNTSEERTHILMWWVGSVDSPANRAWHEVLAGPSNLWGEGGSCLAGGSALPGVHLAFSSNKRKFWIYYLLNSSGSQPMGHSPFGN